MYKRDLYQSVLKLQQMIYEYKEKSIECEKARNYWHQAIRYTRRVNGDCSLVTKVRQNKAFEMRRKMNVDHYGVKQNSNSDSKTKHEEREQE